MDRQRQTETDRTETETDRTETETDRTETETDRADRDCAVPAVQMASAALDRQGAVGRLVQTG